MKADAACLWAWIPLRKVTVPSGVKTQLNRRSGQLMGFLPLSVSLFPVGLPQRSSSVQMEVSKNVHKGECVQMFEFIPSIFVCEGVWVKISFLSLHNLEKWICRKASSICLTPLPACFGLSSSPPCSFHISLWSHSVDIVLYCLFVEAMCIHSELCTFPVNIRDWIHSKKLQLLRPVLRKRPLPCLNISQLQHCLFQIPK